MITLRPLIKGRDIRMACRPSIIHRLAHSYKGTVHTAPTHKCTHIVHSGTRTCAHACCMHSHSTVSPASSWLAASSAAGWCLSGFSVKSLPQPPTYSTAVHTQHITLTNPHSPRDPTLLICTLTTNPPTTSSKVPSLPSNQISS